MMLLLFHSSTFLLPPYSPEMHASALRRDVFSSSMSEKGEKKSSPKKKGYVPGRGGYYPQKKKVEAVVVNNDVCTTCDRDGELLLCDGCVNAYHLECLKLSDVPKAGNLVAATVFFCAHSVLSPLLFFFSLNIPRSQVVLPRVRA